MQEFYKFLPERGLSVNDIICEAELYKTMSEFAFYEGRVSGVIFADSDDEHRALLQKVCTLYIFFFKFEAASEFPLFLFHEPLCRFLHFLRILILCILTFSRVAVKWKRKLCVLLLHFFMVDQALAEP